MPKDIDDKDIQYAEEVVSAMQSREQHDGGPRFSDEVVDVVRGLVTATASLQETTKTMQAAMSNLMAAVEGRAFGDRSDGLNFRVGKLERDSAIRTRLWRTAFAMLTFIFARVGWVEFHEALPAVSHALGFTK